MRAPMKKLEVASFYAFTKKFQSTNKKKFGTRNEKFFQTVLSGQPLYILFQTELHLKNVYDLYSAYSNPTDVV